jgi:hypothetical protein
MTASLSKAFQSLITQQEIPMKLCLFIDGLDEFDGLEKELAKVFKDVVLSPHVKVCVSSRPTVPLSDAFASWPHLRLHDLTNPDIRRFIEDRLAHDELMEDLKSKEPIECRNLMEDIADAAQGVFLWVMLVVSSLLNGLSKHDSVFDLQRRLRELPKELDDLYEEMVWRTDGVYAGEASRLYQLIAEATERQDDWKAAELLSLYSLSLAMKQELKIASEITQASPGEAAIMEEAKKMDIKLKTRCGGLLEVQYRALKTRELSPSLKVSYLHRTVRDFLEADKTRDILLKRSGGSDKMAFKPAVAIFKSIVAEMKHLELQQESHHLKDLGLTYARRIDVDERISPEELLSLFDIFSQVAKLYSMIPSAIECSLCRYLQRKLEDEDTSELNTLHMPALDYALMGPIDRQLFITPEMVSLLIEFGADPNRYFGGFTPWQKTLSHLLRNHDQLDKSSLIYWRNLMDMLLKKGADPNATCQGLNRRTYKGVAGKPEVDLGSTWSVSDVIAIIFETRPVAMASLKKIHHRVIQSQKSAEPKDAESFEWNLSKVALMLNCMVQKPRPSLPPTNVRSKPPQTGFISAEKKISSNKCGLCCFQQ